MTLTLGYALSYDAIVRMVDDRIVVFGCQTLGYGTRPHNSYGAEWCGQG